jgi:glycosyltransferase involved in cell wall biosynthesis
MKVLLNCHTPFMLAHGGQQIQIEQTHKALNKIGISAELLRWWDDAQAGDIIHQFDRLHPFLIELAHKKRVKIVMSELLTAQGARPRWQLTGQRFFVATARRLLPTQALAPFKWKSYLHADACVALTAWEAHLMKSLFGAPAERVHVIPNGVDQIFLNSQPATRGKWLVCTATITERKRVLELAAAAAKAQTPLWIIGNPYSPSDPYARRFFDFAENHPSVIKYEGPVNDRVRLARIYREARGFVLLSAMESLSLSALEAAACECPLLLSDLPWARSTFEQNARYCAVTKSTRYTARELHEFYNVAPRLKTPLKPQSWIEVARRLSDVYANLLKG